MAFPHVHQALTGRSGTLKARVPQGPGLFSWLLFSPSSGPRAASVPAALPDASFLRREKDGAVIVDLHLTPNARHTGLAGLHDGALALRLKAPPVDGKANAALLAWLADTLGVARNSLELVRGQTSRRKQVRVATPVVAQARWQALLADL